MNRKRFFAEVVCFGLTWIIAFLTFFLVVYFQTLNWTEEELRSNLQVAERIFDGTSNDSATKTGTEVIQYFQPSSPTEEEDRLIRISIIQRTENGYRILFDSESRTDASDFSPELDGVGQVTKRRSAYGYNMYYLAMTDQQNPSYYVRAAIKESGATRFAHDCAIYGTIAIVVIMGAYVAWKVVEYRKTIRPMDVQIKRLARLSGDVDESFADHDDLDTLTDSINKVSSELDSRIKALEAERRRTKKILDSISQGFLATDANGTILLFNRAAGGFFGFTEAEALNQNVAALEGGPQFYENVKKVLSTHQEVAPFPIEKNGRVDEVRIMPLEISAKEGQGGAAVLIQDVTDQVNLARTKSDFFANASHELKSPLTAILGYQEMISSGILTTPKDQLDAVNKTILEARKMRSILSDMLTINRLEGKKEIVRMPVDLKDTLKQALLTIEPILKEKNLTLDLKLESLVVEADPSDMDKLFQNLLSNAAKYNVENGSIRILVDTDKRSVTIADTGIGIKEENLPRIFERFYRVDNSRTTHNVEGTGLGLSIVKHIVLLYHYDIQVKSVFGQGTTFVVSNLK